MDFIVGISAIWEVNHHKPQLVISGRRFHFTEEAQASICSGHCSVNLEEPRPRRRLACDILVEMSEDQSLQKMGRPPRFTETHASVLLDLVRGLSALVVLLEHWHHLFFLDFSRLTNHRHALAIPYLLVSGGHQAVVIFFVLSGYPDIRLRIPHGAAGKLELENLRTASFGETLDRSRSGTPFDLRR